MVEAFVLVQTEVGRAELVTKQLAELAGVQQVAGITRTLTCPIAGGGRAPR